MSIPSRPTGSDAGLLHLPVNSKTFLVTSTVNLQDLHLNGGISMEWPKSTAKMLPTTLVLTCSTRNPQGNVTLTNVNFSSLEGSALLGHSRVNDDLMDKPLEIVGHDALDLYKSMAAMELSTRCEMSQGLWSVNGIVVERESSTNSGLVIPLLPSVIPKQPLDPFNPNTLPLRVSHATEITIPQPCHYSPKFQKFSSPFRFAESTSLIINGNVDRQRAEKAKEWLNGTPIVSLPPLPTQLPEPILESPVVTVEKLKVISPTTPTSTKNSTTSVKTSPTSPVPTTTSPPKPITPLPPTPIPPKSTSPSPTRGRSREEKPLDLIQPDLAPRRESKPSVETKQEKDERKKKQAELWAKRAKSEHSSTNKLDSEIANLLPPKKTEFSQTSLSTFSSQVSIRVPSPKHKNLFQPKVLPVSHESNYISKTPSRSPSFASISPVEEVPEVIVPSTTLQPVVEKPPIEIIEPISQPIVESSQPIVPPSPHGLEKAQQVLKKFVKKLQNKTSSPEIPPPSSLPQIVPPILPQTSMVIHLDKPLEQPLQHPLIPQHSLSAIAPPKSTSPESQISLTDTSKVPKSDLLDERPTNHQALSRPVDSELASLSSIKSKISFFSKASSISNFKKDVWWNTLPPILNLETYHVARTTGGGQVRLGIEMGQLYILTDVGDKEWDKQRDMFPLSLDSLLPCETTHDSQIKFRGIVVNTKPELIKFKFDMGSKTRATTFVALFNDVCQWSKWKPPTVYLVNTEKDEHIIKQYLEPVWKELDMKIKPMHELKSNGHYIVLEAKEREMLSLLGQANSLKLKVEMIPRPLSLSDWMIFANTLAKSITQPCLIDITT